MMLTPFEITHLPYRTIKITDSTFFPHNQILEVETNYYTVVEGRQMFPTGGFNQHVRVYNNSGRLYFYDIQTSVCVRVVPVNIIKSYVQEFNGFAPGTEYHLDNGQVWQQINNLSSNCSPGGVVWIKDKCVMRVGNWNFDIDVRRIK